MSFTQKNKTNIKRCDGCKKHCRLEVTTDTKGVIFYPVIDGKTITSYIDKNGKHHLTGKSKQHFNDDSYRTPRNISIAMLDTARKIAKLCDHYKTR